MLFDYTTHPPMTWRRGIILEINLVGREIESSQGIGWKYRK
jgi:hypothetical protein